MVTVIVIKTPLRHLSKPEINKIQNLQSNKQPLVGKTSTNKIENKSIDLVATAFEDRVRLTSYQGKVTEQGKIVTVDASTTNGKVDGES